MSSEVTVVVATRDRRDVLSVALRSVLAQREVRLRVVVVDEASTDGTAELLDRLGDDRVRVVRHDEARGVAAARNTGLAQADTPWVAFCDDDDVWAPDKLAIQLGALAAAPRGTQWSCGGSVMVDFDLEIVDHQRAVDGHVLDRLLGMNVVPGGGSGVLASTDLVRSVGGFDETLANSEDWDLWIRLAERSPIAGVDRPLVGYRIWADSKSRDLGRMEAAWKTITACYEPLAERRGVRPDRSRHQRYLARQQVRAGRRLAASRTYARVAIERLAPIEWIRAVAALTWPAALDAIGTARAARAVPLEWRLEAEDWLGGCRWAPLGALLSRP